MIEVEVRGRLSDKQFSKLRTFLKRGGKLVQKQDREMILLRGYSGYDKNPIRRAVDIRLRNTNGSCEIMLKRKSSTHNVARKETSLQLADSTLDTAKEILKALGYARGLWMHRKKEVYRYRGVEWSLVDVPGGLRYFEAEREVSKAGDAELARKQLTKEAQKLGLSVLGPREMRDFIYLLDKKVNKEIRW